LDLAALPDIVLYLRATYMLLDSAPVIKVSQDKATLGSAPRYVLYFFLSPAPGQNYSVLRAITDYDTSTP
jgi:hypothetical protein